MKGIAEKAARIVGTSASDCEISMRQQAETAPARVLEEVAQTLYWMNRQGIEKLAHRRALMKAGRAALNKLGEI